MCFGIISAMKKTKKESPKNPILKDFANKACNEWFKILEWALLIGAVRVIAEYKKFFMIDIIYYISLCLFFSYFQEVVSEWKIKFIPEKYEWMITLPISATVTVGLLLITNYYAIK